MRVLSVWNAKRDDVAHQPHVLAKVFGQAVVRPLHREQRPAASARSSALSLSARMPLDAALDLAHAGQILVELGLVGGADLAAQRLGVVLHAVEDADGCAGCRGSRTGCRRPARDTLRSAPANRRSARRCASCRPSRSWSRDSRSSAARRPSTMLGCGVVLPEVVGQHLVHADAAVDDRALLQRHAGEHVAGHARDGCPRRSRAC